MWHAEDAAAITILDRAADPDIGLYTPHRRVKQIIQDRAAPRDKATFHLTARVPEGWSVIANWRDEGTSSEGGWTTSSWNEPNPIASGGALWIRAEFSGQEGQDSGQLGAQIPL